MPRWIVLIESRQTFLRGWTTFSTLAEAERWVAANHHHWSKWHLCRSANVATEQLARVLNR